MFLLRRFVVAVAFVGGLAIPAVAVAQSGRGGGGQDGWRDRPVSPGEVDKWGGGDPRGPRWRGEGPAPDGYNYGRGGAYPGTGHYRGGGRGRWHGGRYYPYGVGSCWRWSNRRQDWKWICY